jgi:GDP/UDP-N,N'-diacetylbacillosamine 2-epimerase (hydrolysing)
MPKKIGILSSSRADYSIYIPLIKELILCNDFNIELIVFGSHLSKEHGFTLTAIQQDDLAIYKCIDVGYSTDDSPFGISRTIAQTILEFSEFWQNNKYDLLFCLGDRYEMFAAITAAFPFQIRTAHLYGGETTLGAIDNAFRHCLTHFSNLHFVASDVFSNRLNELIDNNSKIYNLGHLSIDNLKNISFLEIDKLKQLTTLDFTKPTILCTFHPETVAFNKNLEYVNTLVEVFEMINDFQILITMPNTDTGGMVIRKEFLKLEKKCNRVICIESLGTIGYLSAMKHCTMMLGNTSSGFVEASYFPKYVINLGDRQKGRILSKNIFQCEIEKYKILKAIENYSDFDSNSKIEIYGKGNTAQKIVEILKTQFF